MNLVLVSLQPDQPPTGHAHTQACGNATQNHTHDTRRPASPGDGHAQTAAGEHDQEDCQPQVSRPAVMAEMTAEHGKETKDFHGEEGKTEDVGGRRQATRQNGRRHEGGVCRKRSREFGFRSGAVIEGEDVEDHKPAAEGPDGVGRR